MPPPPSPPPPPAFISPDEYSAADPARRRLVKKSRFPRFLSLPNLRAPKEPVQKSSSDAQIATLPTHAGIPDIIRLDPSGLDSEDVYKAKYEWAVVYENQRGMTIFSIPYYSRLSLLPTDPSPFTTPDTSPRRSEQPPISLTDYPLPDGTWRWVSKCWMIDMRSDTGEVQHDGFEYNWMFRAHKWRPHVGSFNSGGWVRRRRWVRLMMRPANQRPKGHMQGRITPASAAGSSFSALIPNGNRHLANISYPPSVISGDLDVEHSLTLSDLWIANDVDVNWTMCRILMKRLGRDGRKLELWKAWLSHYHPKEHAYEKMGPAGKERQKQWTEDDTPMPSELEAQETTPRDPIAQVRIPPKEFLIPVLRKYGNSLLHLFIFPDSRADFLKMLGLAGLLPELNIGLGIGWGASEVDFWSYASGLEFSTTDLK